MQGVGQSPRRAAPIAVALAAALACFAGMGPDGAAAAPTSLSGKVTSGKRPLAGFEVTLYRSRARPGSPVALGSARTGRRGKFSLRYRRPRSNKAVLYAIARRGRHVALASLLGTTPTLGRVAINERTTVAMGSSEAQFLSGQSLAGFSPGPQNAARMSRNLANPRNGEIGRVLSAPPNGSQTSTRRAFNSLSNMVARCVRSRQACETFLRLARPRGAKASRSTLQALVDIARDPSHNSVGLLRFSRAGRPVYRPALKSAPSTWTLILRFDGDGQTMDGPGNFAIDAQGSIWTLNNYEYSADRRDPACGSDLLLRFTPDGHYYPGSPYQGGGINGAGFGITIDSKSRVWVGNFGFSALPPYCPEPPADSVSLVGHGGKILSPSSGYAVGGIDWPQGMATDRKGNIWVANCGLTTTPGGQVSSVTRIPHGDPFKATNISGIGIAKGFGIAVNRRGQVFVAGNNSNSVAILNSDGTPVAGSPITGHGIKHPMGVAADSRGYVWVANSQVIDPPCPPPITAVHSNTGSLTLIGRDDKPVRQAPFKGGGLKTPWGLTVDGDDNVWVANFAGWRISKFCGTRPATCPAGRRKTGLPISPAKTGYGFNGFTRITGVAVDPSGNLWATNNWKRDPGVLTENGYQVLNPGGYQIDVLIGAAAPVKTPLIGAPRPLG